jgi:cytochrome c
MTPGTPLTPAFGCRATGRSPESERDADSFSTKEQIMKRLIALVLTSSLFLALTLSGSAQAAVDTAQAEGLMKANKCNSCHHATKTKSGPSLKQMAEDFKGKADAEELIIAAITTGPKVKIDGDEEEHKIIKTKDQAELKNLAQWILSH